MPRSELVERTAIVGEERRNGSFTDSLTHPVTATYGACVASKIDFWLLPVVVLSGLIFAGFIWIMTLAANEEICFDRWPWWGPPENPGVYTDCTGHYYERHHR
jgi:hypothetical protein